MSVYSGVRPSTLLESSYALDEAELRDVKPFHGSILELAVECEQNEMNMFESVIEMDFLEAALTEADEDSGEGNEKKSTAAEEEATKSIWEKLKDLLKKAWEKIKSFFGTVINKIQQLFANDAKLVAQYEKYWDDEKYLAGFKINNYTPMKEDPTGIDFTNYFGDDLMIRCIGKIDAAESEDAAAKDYLKELLARGDKSWKDYFRDKLFGAKITEETEFLKIKDQFDYVKNVMTGGKRMITTLKAEVNGIKKLLKFDAASVKASRSGMKKLELAKANATYRFYNSVIKELSTGSGAIVSCLNTAISNSRKAYITGGKYAKAKAEEGKSNQTTAEMAMDWMLGEASDAYVESVIYGY